MTPEQGQRWTGMVQKCRDLPELDDARKALYAWLGTPQDPATWAGILNRDELDD